MESPQNCRTRHSTVKVLALRAVPAVIRRNAKRVLVLRVRQYQLYIDLRRTDHSSEVEIGERTILERHSNLMDVLERRCAWCDKELSPVRRVPRVGAVSHGICLDCTVREFGVSFQQLEGLNRAELDALPYGVIALDFEGIDP